MSSLESQNILQSLRSFHALKLFINVIVVIKVFNSFDVFVAFKVWDSSEVVKVSKMALKSSFNQCLEKMRKCLCYKLVKVSQLNKD